MLNRTSTDFASLNAFNERKLGISQYQSAASLQNSVPTISFPKSSRFNLIYKKSGNDNLYTFRTTLNSRSTTQGYGSKWNFAKTNLLSPPPNAYNLPHLGPDLKKGPTISGKRENRVNQTNIIITSMTHLLQE